MRIIGGNLRGKKILNPTDKSTRPLKNMVRESIFNIIEHSKNEYVDLNDAKILDLFSGTGSFGIECLSRGAKNVTFFENYINSINEYFLKPKMPDFILVDGRFRVACCLNIMKMILRKKVKCTILLDDYKKRKYYRILDKYFKIKQIGRMAELIPKNISLNQKEFEKYILDSR